MYPVQICRPVMSSVRPVPWRSWLTVTIRLARGCVNNLFDALARYTYFNKMVMRHNIQNTGTLRAWSFASLASFNSSVTDVSCSLKLVASVSDLVSWSVRSEHAVWAFLKSTFNLELSWGKIHAKLVTDRLKVVNTQNYVKISFGLKFKLFVQTAAAL